MITFDVDVVVGVAEEMTVEVLAVVVVVIAEVNVRVKVAEDVLAGTVVIVLELVVVDCKVVVDVMDVLQ